MIKNLNSAGLLDQRKTVAESGSRFRLSGTRVNPHWIFDNIVLGEAGR